MARCSGSTTKEIIMSLATRLLLSTILASAATAAAAQPCVPDATHLCFLSGTISASAVYQTGGGTAAATAVQPAGGLPGYFRFNDPAAAEIVPGLIDGCGINNRTWVVVEAVSDAGWLLSLTDHPSGTQASYSVPTGEYGTPIVDTQAFPCPVMATPPAEEIETLGVAEMDLFGGRFRVTASIPSFPGEAGQLNRNSGVFAYFDADPDVLVKVFYPGNTGFFGVAASWIQGDTTVQVEDLCTGDKRVYHTGANASFGDPAAFSADDADCGLWANGFESGNTAAWHSTVP
jgi:hypothetical protein